VQEFSAADFDRWLDELGCDAFGDDPAPDEPGWDSGTPPGLGEWDAGPWEDPCQWLDDHGRGHDLGDSAAHRPTPPLAAASGEGWWAAADRAVDQAGTAAHAARLALGAAERMVRTAPTPSARSWPRCCPPPVGVGWPTGRGSRSPTRSAARCWRSPTCPSCAGSAAAALRPAGAPSTPAATT
jgi:hypothetical protein